MTGTKCNLGDKEISYSVRVTRKQFCVGPRLYVNMLGFHWNGPAQRFAPVDVKEPQRFIITAVNADLTYGVTFITRISTMISGNFSAYTL